MPGADSIDLPPWARASSGRRAHIARVVALLADWAQAMQVSDDEAAAWRDAGRWHDALRDASEEKLRAIVNRPDLPFPLLHGPAAAELLRRDGETRADVLEAVASHTTGAPDMARTGRALYMADYLEPGRQFAAEERARLSAQVPYNFDDVYRRVVAMRTTE
jgi:HD superfamily phosphohydrolase YqeK